MNALAPPGAHIRLETDATQDRVDRYGRLLAYVWLPDGQLAETEQLESGWATTYVFHGRPCRSFRAWPPRPRRRTRRSVGSGPIAGVTFTARPVRVRSECPHSTRSPIPSEAFRAIPTRIRRRTASRSASPAAATGRCSSTPARSGASTSWAI